MALDQRSSVRHRRRFLHNARRTLFIPTTGVIIHLAVAYMVAEIYRFYPAEQG